MPFKFNPFTCNFDQVDVAQTAIGGTVTDGTVGSVLFVGTGPVLAQDNANFFWDDSNNRLGIGTASPDRSLHAEVVDGTSNVLYPLRLARTTTLTPAPSAGIGVGIEFEVETINSGNEIGGRFECATNDVTAGSEDFQYNFKLMEAGAAADTCWSMLYTGSSISNLRWGGGGGAQLVGGGDFTVETEDTGDVVFKPVSTEVFRIDTSKTTLNTSGYSGHNLKVSNVDNIVGAFHTNTITFLNESQDRVNNPVFVFNSTKTGADGAWDLVQFQANGSAKFTVDKDGKVALSDQLTVIPNVLTKHATSSFFLHWGIRGGSSNNIGGIFAGNTTLGSATQIFGTFWDGSYSFFPVGNIHIGSTTDPSAMFKVSGNVTTEITAVIKAVASQTADLLQAQDSSGTALVVVDASGDVGIGAATPSAQLHVDQSSTTAAKPVLYLDQADISEEMIEFNTTIGTGNAIEAVGAKSLTVTHFIKCTLPGGLTRYIPVGTIS